MRALKDCNDRVDIQTHPDLHISTSKLNATKDKLEAIKYSTYQNGSSGRYISAVDRDIGLMEEIGRSLPENVDLWKSLLESQKVPAWTDTPKAEHRPVPAPSQPALAESHTAEAKKATPNVEHRPLFPQLQPPPFSAGAPNTANAGSPERKIATARPRTHAVQSNAFAPNIFNAGGVFGAASRPPQSTFTFGSGASIFKQASGNDRDTDREENPEPPKRLGEIAGKTLGSGIANQDDIANQPPLFDEDAMDIALSTPPAVKVSPEATSGAGASATAQQPSPRTNGQGFNDAMDVDSGESTPVPGAGVGNAAGGSSLALPQAVSETRTQAVAPPKLDSTAAPASMPQLTKSNSDSLFGGVPNVSPRPGSISVMGGMRGNTAPRVPVVMPQFSTAGASFQFGNTPNAPAQPNVPQTKTPADVAPLSDVKPVTLGETAVSSQVDAPKSTLQPAPLTATSAPQQDLPEVAEVAENLQDTQSQDTPGAGNAGQPAGPPEVSRAISETAPATPAPASDSQLSQMAAMFQTLQTQFSSMQTAQKALTEQNAEYATRIAALEGEMQTQQAKASADIAALAERCNSLEKSQAARDETAKRLDERERAVASREEAAKEEQAKLEMERTEIAARKAAKEQQVKLEMEQIEIAARNAAVELAPRDTTVAAEKVVSVPEVSASKTSTQIAIEKPVVEVEMVQSSTDAPEKGAVKKAEPVPEVKQVIGEPKKSSSVFVPSSQAVPEIQPEPVHEAAKEHVRKHDPSKGSYGLDYSSGEDEADSESDVAIVRDEPASDTAIVFIDHAAINKGHLRLHSPSTLTADSTCAIRAELTTLLIQHGMLEQHVQSHAHHLANLLNFTSGYAYAYVEVPGAIHKEITAFIATMQRVFLRSKIWLHDIGKVAKLHTKMYNFVNAVKTYGGLFGIDALLNDKDLPAAMEVCVAYLRALEAVWLSLPRGSDQSHDMHQLLKDEDVALRAHVNGIVKTVGWFVTVSLL